MKAKDFEVGSLICSINDHRRGTIIGNKFSDPETVAVEWNNEELEKVNVHDLQLVSTALEEEWNIIENNIKQATNLLIRANDIAAKYKTSLYEMIYDDSTHDVSLYSLKDELQKIGWSPSTLSC